MSECRNCFLHHSQSRSSSLLISLCKCESCNFITHADLNFNKNMKNLSKNHDYIFDFKSDLLSFYIHTMNFSLLFAHTVNKTDKSVIISQQAQIDTLTE